MLSGLKLRTRLALAFGVLLALQVAMAAAALQQLATIGALKAQQSHAAESRRLVLQWSAQTRMNVVRALMLAKAGSPPALAAWTDGEMKRASAQITELQRELEPRLADPEAKAAMASIARARKAYVDLRAGLMARLGNPRDAAQALAEVDTALLPAADGYLKALDGVVAHVGAQLDAQSAAMDASLARAQTLLPWLTACALLIGALLAWAVARSLVRPIRDAIATARDIAQGDLTHDVAVTRRDELGELQSALAEMQRCLRGMVAGIRSGTDNVSVATTQIASGNLDLSMRTEQAASSLQQTAATMAQLTDTVRLSADSALTANALAGSAAEVARRGGEVVSRVIATMAGINDGSNRIADIIGTIDGIAFQTNILALNAAVEAARAGEQGRGFAVVAAEVRNLAGRSADAAREIKALIGASVTQVSAGTALVRDAGTTMQELVQSVQRVSEAIGEITASASGQAAGIGEVNTAVGQLDRITQQNAALVEEAAAAAQSLKDQAVGLARMVLSFRLAPGAAPA